MDEPDCSGIQRLCTGLSETKDILILECLQSLDSNVLARIPNKCQNNIWEHTSNIISNERIRDSLGPVCRNDLTKLMCKDNDEDPYGYFKCIVNNQEDIKDPDCINMIHRIEGIAFSDYRWIMNFLNDCREDIKTFQCGRIDQDRASQSKTIMCLQDHISEVQPQCKQEIFKISQIQSDNVRLDQQLYMECIDDQQRFCPQFAPGSGRVLKCLLRHVDEPKLSDRCRVQLLRRERLIAQDYRVSKGLMRACRDAIKASHCRRQTSNDRETRLAQILICLENVQKLNGSKGIGADCEAEMLDHRKMLMEDYRMSPEIVKDCANDIKEFCTQLDVGGKTIHCLMEHARRRNEKRISAVCERAMEGLIKESDVGEDWRVDPVLHEACFPVVQSVCRDVKGGDARVISCLMDNIDTEHMKEDCEDALIQIQYFVARDFKLDPQLFRECKDDAAQICSASKDWDEHGVIADNGPLILPCLYRNAYIPDEQHAKVQLQPGCLEQIKRVMRQRALSVDLHPEVEQTCIAELGTFCFDKVEKGQEILCLQDNMENLQPDCKKAMMDLTEIQAEHTELNPYISANCKRVIEMFCSEEQKKDEGDIMDCLIKQKNNPIVKTSNSNCRASIEHFQLISLKNYRFTYKFKLACKPYALRFCAAARTKAEVVGCLSEKVTNDTLAGVKSDVQKECRQQLKAQLFQQRENISYDPKLNKACQLDITKFCKNIEKGQSQVLECLQALPEDKLTDKCQVELFKVKKQETSDNTVDYALMTMCASAIDEFCRNVEKSQVIDCLKSNKDKRGFNKQCHTVVTHRIIEQNSDYRLNPALQQSCKQDINKFCIQVLENARSEHGLHGAMIKCLKGKFKEGKLTNKCEMEMVEILREQALDVRLNPLLRAVCRDELDTICKQDDSDEDAGKVEECLKNNLLAKKLQTRACMEEVANLIEESQADINVDPVLHNACKIDLLKYCADVQQGNGRQIKCLKILLDGQQLTPECKDMLEKRLAMYKNAAEVPPEDLRQLYVQVTASPSKHYFFLIFLMMVCLTFVIGIMCGRVTRRHTLLKNK